MFNSNKECILKTHLRISPHVTSRYSGDPVQCHAGFKLSHDARWTKDKQKSAFFITKGPETGTWLAQNSQSLNGTLNSPIPLSLTPAHTLRNPGALSTNARWILRTATRIPFPAPAADSKGWSPGDCPGKASTSRPGCAMCFNFWTPICSSCIQDNPVQHTDHPACTTRMRPARTAWRKWIWGSGLPSVS